VIAGPHETKEVRVGLIQTRTREAASTSRLRYDRTIYDEEMKMEVKKH
jgi:hypothetical protein